MAEYYPPARPPPPSPWMPLFFISVLVSMWTLPVWLRSEPVLVQTVNQLSILLSLAVPIVLLYLLQWASSSTAKASHLQYPNSRFGYHANYNSYPGTFSDPQAFGWGLLLILVLFLLVSSTAGRVGS